MEHTKEMLSIKLSDLVPSPKAQIFQALRIVGPGLAADGVESMKKDALVTAALARLKGTLWLSASLRPVSG